MKQIFQYILLYLRDINRKLFVACTLFTAVMIWANYGLHVDARISSLPYLQKTTGYFMVYALAFGVPYAWLRMTQRNAPQFDRGFYVLLFSAAMLFALKHTFTFPIHGDGAAWTNYWQHVIYWPLLAALMVAVLFVIWKMHRAGNGFYGTEVKHISLRPYFLMLLMMVPLVAAASTQPDFLAMYPKMKIITGDNDFTLTLWHKLLFELSYGTDFITIEIFFRGFLVLGFVKWAGRDAILPMACFYCTIHFGKPLGECISSYFGGLILGIVVYHTRSIAGGLLVHVGIAWLMEAGGLLGNTLK